MCLSTKVINNHLEIRCFGQQKLSTITFITPRAVDKNGDDDVKSEPFFIHAAIPFLRPFFFVSGRIFSSVFSFSRPPITFKRLK